MKSGSLALFAVLIAIATLQTPGTAQGIRGDATLTYTKGQSVMPVFHGWELKPDGSHDLHFSYVNLNWEEEVDIPIGAENSISPTPYGPDAGQPTHFYPRVNRWIFSVHVPADFGSKEVVWTLTSHGQTHRAYGTLKPGYEIDAYLMQFEFGGFPVRGRKPPVIQFDGSKQRTVKVGESIPLIAVATDDQKPQAAPAEGEGRGRGPAGPGEIGPGLVGGDFIRLTAGGLRFAWLVYRGTSHGVTFDPPMPFKVWEDQRGGSAWAPNFQSPLVPPGNKWIYNVKFAEPGAYVLRAVAHNGNTFSYENVTFTVTR